MKIVPKQNRRRNVVDHHYDGETGHLTVTFHNGRRYLYRGVDADTAGIFKGHDSPGSFLRGNIIGKFDAMEIFDDK